VSARLGKEKTGNGRTKNDVEKPTERGNVTEHERRTYKEQQLWEKSQ
jgi:hypothetical protein